MKKLAKLIPPLIYLISFSKVAAVQEQTIIINKPAQGYATLGVFITNILTILFAFGAIILLFMIVWGAYEWITSGGDKEAVGHARGRIVAGLIGLAILAAAFALAQVAARFLGFTNGLNEIPIPTPG